MHAPQKVNVWVITLMSVNSRSDWRFLLHCLIRLCSGWLELGLSSGGRFCCDIRQPYGLTSIVDICDLVLLEVQSTCIPPVWKC
jgi:hypothetical protein